MDGDIAHLIFNFHKRTIGVAPSQMRWQLDLEHEWWARPGDAWLQTPKTRAR